MKLKLVLSSLDGLDEALKQFYVERDGKFFLDAEPAEGLEVADVSKTMRALEAERRISREANAKVKAFEGLDADAARDALAKLEELGDDATVQKKVDARVAAREAQLSKLHNEAIEKATKRAERLEVNLKEQLIDHAATDALLKAGGRVKLMLPHVRDHIRMRETEDGRFEAEVVGADGSPRIGGLDGRAMTIPQLVEELKGLDEFKSGFDGTGHSGTGAQPSARTSGSGSTHRISAQDAKDHAKYQAAKDAAEKAGVPLEVGNSPHWGQPTAT